MWKCAEAPEGHVASWKFADHAAAKNARSTSFCSIISACYTGRRRQQKRLSPLETADFYICGSKPFARAIVGDLLNLNVSRDRIHYEFFEPTDEALAA